MNTHSTELERLRGVVAGAGASQPWRCVLGYRLVQHAHAQFMLGHRWGCPEALVYQCSWQTNCGVMHAADASYWRFVSEVSLGARLSVDLVDNMSFSDTPYSFGL
eukprot:jgi/Ulvmu1/2171/UM013_0015.1